MEISKMDIYPLIFRRIQKEQNSEFSMDIQMLSVLIEINGKNSIGAIAKKTNMDLDHMRSILLKLTELGLIEPVEDNAISFIDVSFFDHIREHLLFAVGPFADILIEDTVYDMGYEINKFPAYRASEMINALAKEIRNADKKSIFLDKASKLVQTTEFNG